MWRTIDPAKTPAKNQQTYKFNFFFESDLNTWSPTKLKALQSQLNQKLLENKYVPVDYKQGRYAISIATKYAGNSPFVQIVVTLLLLILVSYMLTKLTYNVQELVEAPGGFIGIILLIIVLVIIARKGGK